MTQYEKAAIPSARRILAKKIKLLRATRGWSSATAPCVALPSHIPVGRMHIVERTRGLLYNFRSWQK